MERKLIRHLLATALIVTFAFNSFAQVRIGSPYSRYGLGDINSGNSPFFLSMGGTAFGIRSSAFVNHANPASYTAFDTTSFVFEGGVYSQSSTIKSVSASQSSSYSSIGSILIGFPISKKIKASFGLLPYSSVGYKIADNKSLVISADSSTAVSNIYDGSGGINKAYFGFGFNVFKNLSFGVNADFLFGTIKRNSTSNLTDLLYANSYRRTTFVKVNDFNFNFGLQ